MRHVDHRPPLRALKLLDQSPARGEALVDGDDLAAWGEHDRARHGQHAEGARDVRLARGVDLDHTDYFRAQVCFDRPDRGGLRSVAGGARRRREAHQGTSTIGCLTKIGPCFGTSVLCHSLDAALAPGPYDDDRHGHGYGHAQEEQEALEHL